MKKDFDLNSFLIDSEDVVDQGNLKPSWVSLGTETTKILYRSVLEEKNEIGRKIKSGEKLTVNERKIVNRRIALENGLDPSNLSVRRQPELMNFIDEVNVYLLELWRDCNRKKGAGVRNLSRKELEKEVVSLRKEKKRLEQSFCKDSIEKALSTVFVNNQVQLSQEIKELRKINEEKDNTISNLRSELRKYQIKGI